MWLSVVECGVVWCGVVWWVLGSPEINSNIFFFNEYVHSKMYYLCMCNELYSVSNCIDYARSAFMTRHVNIIYNGVGCGVVW